MFPFRNFILLTPLFFAVLVFGTETILKNGKFILNTKVEDGTLTVKIVAETKGYVGFGIWPNRDMIKGADVVICGWDPSRGAYIGDFKLYPTAPPKGIDIPNNASHETVEWGRVLDKQQDAKLIGVSENATHTTVQWSRALDTGDYSEDFRVLDEAGFHIWAIGADDTLAYHGPDNRGVVTLNLIAD